MGKHHRRTTPVYRPGSVYFCAGMLIIFAFGITLAAIEDTYTHQRWTWFTIFASAEAILVALYGMIVESWLDWIDQSSDYNGVDASVDCIDGHHHHPGEHCNP